MGNQASCGMLGQPINTENGQKLEQPLDQQHFPEEISEAPDNQHQQHNQTEILQRIETSTILTVPHLDHSSMPDSDLEEISSLESNEDDDFQDCEEPATSGLEIKINQNSIDIKSDSTPKNSIFTTKSEYSKSIDTLSTNSQIQSPVKTIKFLTNSENNNSSSTSSSLVFDLDNPAKSASLKSIKDSLIDIILTESNSSINSSPHQLLCMNELMAIPLLLVTLETIGINKIKEYVHIDSKKDFNPFGKAAMMIYGALLQQHFGETNTGSMQSSSGVSCENDSSTKSSQDELQDNNVVNIENSNNNNTNSTKSQNRQFNNLKTGMSDFVVKYVHDFIKSSILQENDKNNSQNKIDQEETEQQPKHDDSSIDNQISFQENKSVINCDNYMYNIKRICAHDDLTLGHMLASKRCFPMQSKAGASDVQNQIQESLQIHSALDIFLQLSCTAMHSLTLWRVINESIVRLQQHLNLPITSLLNKVS